MMKTIILLISLNEWIDKDKNRHYAKDYVESLIGSRELDLELLGLEVGKLNWLIGEFN